MQTLKSILKKQHELSVALESQDSLEDVLTTILDFLLEIEEFEGGGVYIIDQKTGSIDLIKQKKLPMDLVEGFSHYDSDSPQAAIINEGNPVYANYENLKSRLEDKPIQSPLKAVAIIPLIYKNRAVGSINLASFSIKQFSEESKELLEALVDTFCNAIGRSMAVSAQFKSEEKFKSYIENAPNGIFVADENGNYIDVNKTACEMTGYSRAELLGLNLLNLTPKKNQREAYLSFQQLMETGKIDIEIPFVKKDGTKGIWSVSSVKLSDNCFLGFTNDITEERELETRLKQREKMEAIGQLAGGVAHDFNNQLACIMGNADLLHQEVANNENLSGYTKSILTATVHAKDLIFQLLAFARKGKHLTTPVDVHKVIIESVSLLKHSLDKRIRIIQQFNANPSTILGDQVQLENVFLNMALNARDAMNNQGEIRFTTDTATLSEKYCKEKPYEVESGEYLRVLISDNGSGIPEDKIKHIFEPFYTTKEVGKGTGMGLAAAYGTIKNHKGFIEVSSIPGEGTEFEIYLPLATENVTSLDPNSDMYSDVVKGEGHILLVDDEKHVLDFTEKMLRNIGYEVTTSNNGQEALELFRKNHNQYDLIVLDMIMPELNGKDTYFGMKGVQKDLNVIISSGYAMDGEVQKVLNAGAHSFIQKPFRLDELSKKIAKAINS